MSDPSIRVSSECRETNYQGVVTGPTEFIQLRSSITTAGLVAGDQILAINGRPVRELTLVDWRAEWARSSAAGTPVQLRVRRSGSEIDLPVPAGERAAVEGQLPQVSSFQCENPRGELSTESFVLDGANAAFFRVGDNAWQRVTKGSSERFVVGVFDGRAGVRSEGVPVVVPASPRPSPVPVSPVLRGGHAVGGVSVLLPVTLREDTTAATTFGGLTLLGEFGIGHADGVGQIRLFGDAALNLLGGSLGSHLVYQFNLSDTWHLGPAVGYMRLLTWPQWDERSDMHLIGAGLELSHTFEQPTTTSSLMGEAVLKIFYSRMIPDGTGPFGPNPTNAIILGFGVRGGSMF